MLPCASAKSATAADAVLLVAFHPLGCRSKAGSDVSATLDALVGAEHVEQGEVVVACRETLRNAAVDRVHDYSHLVLLVDFRVQPLGGLEVPE